MSSSITFNAEVETVSGGDDEVRVQFAVKKTPVDEGAAVALFGLLNRVFQVTVYQPNGNGVAAEISTFPATIPPGITSLSFGRKKRPQVKLNVPASDANAARLLIGYNEHERLRVEAERDQAQASAAEMRRALEGVVSPDDCALDHHGYCQAHGWLAEGLCPQVRARAALSGEAGRELLAELERVKKERQQAQAEAARHKTIWWRYEQEYILPCFAWAAEVGIDLRALVATEKGHNCVELLVRHLLAEVERKRWRKRR